MSEAKPDYREPFSSTQSDKLIAINSGDYLCFLQSSLLRYILSPLLERRVVPWEEWGPHQSRLVYPTNLHISLAATFGTKLLTYFRKKTGGVQTVVMIYGFNLMAVGEAVKRSRSNPTELPSQVDIHTTPTTTRVSHGRTLRTSLPYCSWATFVPALAHERNPENVFFSEDHIGIDFVSFSSYAEEIKAQNLSTS